MIFVGFSTHRNSNLTSEEQSRLGAVKNPDGRPAVPTLVSSREGPSKRRRRKSRAAAIQNRVPRIITPHAIAYRCSVNRKNGLSSNECGQVGARSSGRQGFGSAGSRRLPGGAGPDRCGTGTGRGGGMAAGRALRPGPDGIVRVVRGDATAGGLRRDSAGFGEPPFRNRRRSGCRTGRGGAGAPRRACPETVANAGASCSHGRDPPR